MPKRIVDGEALWTSSKLRKVYPPEFRFHYANWLPLAEANGVFEADFDIIWSRIYAPMYPDFCTETVRKVFEEFVKVGLIRPFDDAGKKYGYFTGIEKPGRLPSDKHMSRYRNLPPNPPELSRTVPESPEGFGIGLVLDRIGIGEEGMNIKNSLTDLSRSILGVRIGPQDSNWSEIKALVRVYGEDLVTGKFEEWAKTQTSPPSYPLSGFVRIADALLSGKFASGVSPEDLSALVNDLVSVSDGRVIFNNNQRAALGALLAGNSPADIKSAFQEFWGNIDGDEFLIKQAAKTFTEAAEQLLFVQSKRRTDAQKTAEQIRISTENEQARAAEQARRLLEAEVEEQALVEDSLGGD